MRVSVQIAVGPFDDGPLPATPGVGWRSREADEQRLRDVAVHLRAPVPVPAPEPAQPQHGRLFNGNGQRLCCRLWRAQRHATARVKCDRRHTTQCDQRHTTQCDRRHTTPRVRIRSRGYAPTLVRDPAACERGRVPAGYRLDVLCLLRRAKAILPLGPRLAAAPPQRPPARFPVDRRPPLSAACRLRLRLPFLRGSLLNALPLRRRHPRRLLALLALLPSLLRLPPPDVLLLVFRRELSEMLLGT
mmetsp:Transcript_62964/g.148272  ORF Transcript_62964/g.148272 Transcript_62964/m.148272 type:complete len:245 (+) Transcript_62964:1324-2058(+)